MSTMLTRSCFRGFLATVALLLSASAPAETIVLPNVTGFVLGAQNALWSTEFRITNLAGTETALRVVDWLGLDGALQEIVVSPGETKILSGWEFIYGGHRGRPVRPEEDVFGAAICETESGLLVQSSIQTYTFQFPGGGNGTGGDVVCWSWLGGYDIDDTFPN